MPDGFDLLSYSDTPDEMLVIPGGTGLLDSPGDPDAIPEAVVFLLRDPDIRQRMSVAART